MALSPNPIVLTLELRAAFKPAIVDPKRLIVETGSGVPSANSYISLEDARAYFIGRRLNSAGWTSAQSELQEAALKQASAILDAEFTWTGTTPVNPNQGLLWPFIDARDRYFRAITGIPKVLKEAVCELAFFLLSGSTNQDQPGMGIKELKVDVITIVFDKSDQVTTIPPHIVRMLYGIGFQSRGSIRNIKMIRG